MAHDRSQDSQDVENATIATLPSPVQPDEKTRRYDRQLRLWATSGQNALELSRILVVSATATATSILKNLVLPGIGHFTILDSGTVMPEDAGNNFFFEGLSSVGKSRAEEAVRLLSELNDSVKGEANTSTLEYYLTNDPTYLLSFTVIITHNIAPILLSKLSALLWTHHTSPSLFVVRSAGFLAEFFIQFHVHTIVDSHSETAPSLRIDKAFSALLEHAMSLDLEGLDITEHSHIPYVIILVRAITNWKNTHDGALPKSYAEKQEFKDTIATMKRKPDEENFDEAIAQAYRAWTPTSIPSEIQSLFTDASVPPPESSPANAIFYHLLDALQRFTQRAPHVLPLSATLPDMKSDTASYVHLQTLYKAQAEKERSEFAEFLNEGIKIDSEAVDEFVRNAHGLRALRGAQFAKLDADKKSLATALRAGAAAAAIHVALSALAEVQRIEPADVPTLEKLTSAAHTIVEEIELDEDATEQLDNALREIARAPTAELPNTAAFLGGLVAQEAIKMITRQYVPITGYCVVDLAGSWTGLVCDNPVP